MANKDLRDWIPDLEANGQVQHFTGVEREEEIGALVDVHAAVTNPAVMFDEILAIPKAIEYSRIFSQLSPE